MIKRTLYFGNPAYLSTRDEQLKVRFSKSAPEASIPIEDIGVLVLDCEQITITQAVMAKLLANNVALISCNDKHHPTGMMLNLDGHTRQHKHFEAQIEAALPLKKQLWQSTIKAKIANQAEVLARCNQPNQKLLDLASKVLSGDSANAEAQAAAFYWKSLLGSDFKRERFGDSPNHLFNYGYSILRASTARSLTASGLLPTFGIHHRNQYNAYCLADDIMEPYRPVVDWHILQHYGERFGEMDKNELSKEDKVMLLNIPVIDVQMGKKNRPLSVALSETTASLAKSFLEKENKIVYPKLY